MLDLAQQGVELKQRDVERKSSLVKNNVGSQLDLDNSATALVTAERADPVHQAAAFQCEDAIARQCRIAARAVPALRAGQGRARRCPAQSRPHRDARADGRRRHAGRADPARPLRRRRHAGILRHRRRQPLGRRQPEGIATSPMSRSAKPSRSRSMRSRTIVFKGTVGSLSPGTGAQFAILPPQNATGNFVKVVQRVPVRIYFDKDDTMVRKLKAGMSVYATIDTNHSPLAGRPARPAVGGRHPRAGLKTMCRRRPRPAWLPACAGTW